LLSDDVTTKTATVLISGSATAPHVICGTFDGTNLIAYADGTAALPSPACLPTPTYRCLQHCAVHGATQRRSPFLGPSRRTPSLLCLRPGRDPRGAYTYGFNENQAQYSGADLISPTQIADRNPCRRKNRRHKS
jgi:hypothetical protein